MAEAVEGRTRVVPIEQWGRVVVEELLFRAAKDVSARGVSGVPVTIDLPVSIVADASTGELVLRCPDAVDGRIELRLELRS